MTRKGADDPRRFLSLAARSTKAWYTSACTIANFTPGSKRRCRMLAAEPSVGMTSSEMSALGATYFARSAPIAK
jgi:hypothetical protein